MPSEEISFRNAHGAPAGLATSSVPPKAWRRASEVMAAYCCATAEPLPSCSPAHSLTAVSVAEQVCSAAGRSPRNHVSMSCQELQ